VSSLLPCNLLLLPQAQLLLLILSCLLVCAMCISTIAFVSASILLRISFNSFLSPLDLIRTSFFFIIRLNCLSFYNHLSYINLTNLTKYATIAYYYSIFKYLMSHCEKVIRYIERLYYTYVFEYQPVVQSRFILTQSPLFYRENTEGFRFSRIAWEV